MKVAVTIACPIQVGVDKWITKPSTKIFDADVSIELMLRWIKSSGSLEAIRDLQVRDGEDA
jgi:hypothetical protein